MGVGLGEEEGRSGGRDGAAGIEHGVSYFY